MSLHQEPHHDLLGDLLHRIMGVVIFRDQSAKGADETGEWMMFTRGAAIKQLIHDSHCFVSRVYSMDAPQSHHRKWLYVSKHGWGLIAAATP